MRKRKPRNPDAVLAAELDTAREVGTLVRHWWHARTLSAIDRTKVSLPQAWSELQFFVCAYLIRRLNDENTPEDVKDAIALRLSPQLGILLKGPPQDRERDKAIGNPLSEAHEIGTTPAATPVVPVIEGPVGALLQSYGLTKTPQ